MYKIEMMKRFLAKVRKFFTWRRRTPHAYTSLMFEPKPPNKSVGLKPHEFDIEDKRWSPPRR